MPNEIINLASSVASGADDETMVVTTASVPGAIGYKVYRSYNHKRETGRRFVLECVMWVALFVAVFLVVAAGLGVFGDVF